MLVTNHNDLLCSTNRLNTQDTPAVPQAGQPTGGPSADDYGYDEQPTVDNSATADVKLQAINYLSEQTNSLTILHSFEAVKKLFMCYNTTLPSSAPVEHLFSAAGLIETSRRNRLADQTFERLLLLKQNKTY
jgi:hypothetical protein